MIEFLYNFWIQLISAILGFFVTISAFMNTVFLDGFRDVIIGSGPVVLDILSFWFDTDLFPSIFQGAVIFYVGCYFLNLLGRLLSRLWDLLPFA